MSGRQAPVSGSENKRRLIRGAVKPGFEPQLVEDRSVRVE
jgi:hypothetical protein